MADLSLHAVQWCAQHGHPVLALRTSDDRYFVVALTADDAGALAQIPDSADSSRSPRRLYGLVEATVTALGARLTEVWLHVGRDAMLRASLHLRGPQGDCLLPANFADGIALAHRGRLPLRMADDDLGRVPLAPLTPLPEPGPATNPSLPPEAFRALIESLDLDHLSGSAGDAGTTFME
jgi:hypothetical protein